MLLAFLSLSTSPLLAEQSDLFTYEVNSGEVTISDYPLDATGSAEIPAEIDGFPVVSIGAYAFSRCTGLTSLSIPDSVTSIGEYAFYGCSGLTSLSIPDSVTSIGRYAFYDCTGLTSLAIPDSVTGIGSSAFSGCTGLTSVTIPDSVTFINDQAFFKCSGLTSLTIPDSVTSISSRAFSGCSGLTFLTISASVTVIHSGTFSGCTGLTSLSIPDSVTSIGGSAFSGCTGLTSITIPDSVISIGGSAFYGCTGLTSLSIPDSVTSIGDYAFSNCTGLTSLTIPDSVTSIGEYAFRGCTGLTSLTIPDRVTSIGEYAFSGCTGLTSIEVDGLNPVYSSLDGIVFNKNKTILILYPAGRSGGYTIPDSVTSMQSRSLLFAAGDPSYVGQGAFEGSSQLTSVQLPDGITRIGSETFQGCSALTTVTIPTSVTSIGNSRFYWEPDLAGAFEDCTSLHSAVFLGDAPTFNENTFANTAPGFTIYYLSCSTGFTSPTWNGYPTVRIDERACSAAPWLVSHGLPYDTDLKQDLNGDGVSLLMAYALDLDPTQNLQSKMPAPVLDGSSLGMTFHAASPGITYTVETSTDLRNWTTEGVLYSPLAPDGTQTASVSRDVSSCFLRLVVEN
ncbi:leucine-rich repeat domain-containing protein [Haloferula chungangensis]|uniref:Leucine-rich repeat domain-containing protein n=1 Tax=Haloferula chungangensis TaxID=1048331 RepID=A0ABW2L6W6_9BACT